MGGKRPDQYAIDPSETNSTDRLHLEDERLHDAEKRQVAESRVEATRESFIPKGAENPALADLRARREAKERESQQVIGPDAEREA